MSEGTVKNYVLRFNKYDDKTIIWEAVLKTKLNEGDIYRFFNGNKDIELFESINKKHKKISKTRTKALFLDEKK